MKKKKLNPKTSPKWYDGVGKERRMEETKTHFLLQLQCWKNVKTILHSQV